MSIRESILAALEKEMKDYSYDFPSMEGVELTLSTGETIAFVEHEFDDWDDQGKYQYRDEVTEACIYRKEEDLELLGIYFLQSVQRSGSYFSDYHYTNDAPAEVELHIYEKTITVRDWVLVQ